jgi:integrase
MAQPLSRYAGRRVAHLSLPPARRSKREASWEEAVQAFLDDKRREGRRAGTLDVYRFALASPRTEAFRVDHGVRRPADLTVEKVKAFQLELIDAQLRPNTVSQIGRTLATFARWAEKEGYGVSPDVLKVSVPRPTEKIPRAFSEAKERSLIDAAPCERDKFMIRFLIRTGLRLGEAMRLELGDFETYGQDFFLVRDSKTGKPRVVPLHGGWYDLRPEVKRYRARVRPQTECPYFFLTSRRTGGDYKQLDDYSAKTLFRRLSARTGIHAHAHKCRDTFATRCLAAGMDVVSLQHVMGHKHLQMTSRYIQFTPEVLLAAWVKKG